ncbi:MAG: glycosyltransferase [Alphaproteobacteria bacterium]
MAIKSIIVTLYPLTTDYIQRFSEKFSVPAEQIVISNITAKSYWHVFRTLRAHEAETVYLPLVDTPNLALIPLFKVLAAVARTRNSYIVMPDFVLLHSGILDGIAGAARIVKSSAISFFYMFKDLFSLWQLSKQPRIVVEKGDADNILYLRTTLWLGLKAGGSVAHTRGVVKGLLDAGQPVHFMSMESDFPLVDHPNLKILAAGEVPPTYVVPRELNNYRFNNRTIVTATRLAQGAYKAIYQRHSRGIFAGVVMSRLKKVPLILEYNGSEIWLAQNWGRRMMLGKPVALAEAVCLKHAHLIVTVSDILKDELISRGVDEARIVSYPNGVDPDEFDSQRFSDEEIRRLRNHHGVPDGSVLLTFVGTFGHWHGAEFLAETLAMMMARDPAWFESNDVRICFVGDGVNRDQVAGILANIGLSSRAVVTGTVSQDMTPLYMAASDILISPHVPNRDGSPFFGSPTKLFEYMSAGRAIIASDLYQIAEVMEGAPHVSDLAAAAALPGSEQCGVLVKPLSVSELSEAIRFLVENPDWRRAAGDNARKRVVARYTWRHHVEAILQGLDRQ